MSPQFMPMRATGRASVRNSHSIFTASHTICKWCIYIQLYKGGGNKKIRNRTETDKQKKQKLEQVELYLEDALLGWFVHKVAEHEASKVGVKTLVPDKYL